MNAYEILRLDQQPSNHETKMTTEQKSGLVDELLDHIDQLQVEVERLQAALKEIADLDYTRAGTNSAAYYANKIAVSAINNENNKEAKTDKDKLIKLLSDFGVGFEIEPDERFGGIERVECSKGMSKIGGYDGHAFSWYFNKDGGFVEVKVWL